MNPSPLGRSLRRGLAAAAIGALTASLLGAQPASADVPTPTHGATVDYFDDVYDHLGANSVFETVTIERFEYLLKNKSGNFAFFIGDPHDPSSQATIGHVNAVAKRLGISKIYNFTPKLDGDTLNVWDLSASGLTTAGKTFYATVGDRLISDYLNKDTETQFTKNAATDPYLFVYDKDRTVGGAEDRIVAALSGAKTEADLDTTAEVQAYENQVESVLGSAGPIAVNTNFEFQKTENNRRHAASYPNAETHGGDILTDADAADGFRIQTLTYPELIHLVQQPGDIPILFGGTWCHNTRAIIKFVNADAQEYGVRTVYNFDFSLFSTGNGGSDYGHIRDNALPTGQTDTSAGINRPSHLYGDLVNEYLTNAVTQYRTAADVAELGGSANAVTYYPGGDTSKATRQARKIQVGHVLVYNKDHEDALGEPAPVVDQGIRQNDDGGNTEHMTEWWYTAGRDLARGDTSLRGTLNPASESGANQLQSQRAFAKEAIDEIDTVFQGLAGQNHASTTTVTGVGGADDPVVARGGTPTVNISVAAAGFEPFVSLNTANQDAAANNAVGKPRGIVAVFDGDTKVGQARLKRDGTASITLPAQTAGQKSLTVRYLGRGEVIAPSQATVPFSVVGDSSTTTLGGPSSLTFGAGGTVTATVPSDATGKVRLAGLGGTPLEATVDEGTATFALPEATAAGSYSLVASYLGDAKYGASDSSALDLTVAKAASSLIATVRGTTYGTAPGVAVKVTGAKVPTGAVTVTVAGKAYRAAVAESGTATVALPRTLAPKSYALTVVYSGDSDLKASSGTGSLSVAKGVAGRPTFKAGSVRAGRKAKAAVAVPTSTGLARASGKVRVVLVKGRTTKTVTATVASGKASVTLPKLTKGTWSVRVTHVGDATYRSGSTLVTKLRVRG